MTPFELNESSRYFNAILFCRKDSKETFLEGTGHNLHQELKPVGISRCKLLYREWINKVLLYSTGNYIQP